MAENVKQLEGVYKHAFRTEVSYNGEQIKEITFNFGGLTGEDAINIEDELTAEGKVVLSPAFSGDYLMRMAAKAADVPIGDDFFRYIPIGDYNTIRARARSFLLASE